MRRRRGKPSRADLAFAAGNPLRLKALTLKLDDPQPSYAYELDGGPPNAPVGRFGGPIGFDGRFAVGGRMPYGPSAARGAWSADGASFLFEVQTLGNDDVARVTHVFGDKTIELSTVANGSGEKCRRGDEMTRPKPAIPQTGQTDVMCFASAAS